MSEADDSKPKPKDRNRTFDYVTLRLLVGVIAFAIPIVVVYLAYPDRLESISASYHTDAQDAFVGMLFIVAAFLLAYRGHSPTQGHVSKIGAVAAAVVAVCPTSTAKHPDLTTGPPHYVAAATLFLILVYFCYAFWKKTRGSDQPMKRRRGPLYLLCGIVILLCVVTIAVANWFFGETAKELRITYWGEWLALWAFGAAWIIAGKTLPFLSTSGERPRLLEDLGEMWRQRQRDKSHKAA
jgi:Na+/H+ antiporter NhaD/arsenite permease-like protein